MSTSTPRSGPATSPARVDRVDGGVRTVRRARELRELRDEVGIRELPSLFTKRIRGGILRLPFRPRLCERIEVVAVAHIDERLATIVDLPKVVQQVVRSAERHMRAMADFRGTFRADGSFQDVARREAVSRNASDRLIEPAPIVGQVNLDRRCPRREDAEHVPLVDQFLRDRFQQLAYARRVGGVEVKIVDEDEEDAPRDVARRTDWRQDDALGRLCRRGCADVDPAAAMDERERDDRLRDAVLEDAELTGLQVRHEQTLRIPHDHVRRDQRGLDAVRSLALLCG